MQFLHPYFLFGLLAVAVPIIIHLFNFRRYKKIFFSNVSLINEVKQETRKRSQLLHLIILLLRILAIIALVLVFAQPYVPYAKHAANPKAVSYVSIYIDNSFSMQADGINSNLIEEAKTKALEITAAYKPSDYFQLVTNNFDPRHYRFASRDEFAEMLREVEVSPFAKNIAEVARRQAESFKDIRNAAKNVYYISDFQKNTTLSDQFKPDTTIKYYFVPLKSNTQNNLYIDSCWFESPVHLVGQKAKLIARVKNLANAAVEKVPLKLMVNNVQKAVSSFDIGPNTTADITITYTDAESGIHQCMLEIADSPITWDDNFYFSYSILKSIPLLSINGSQPSVYLNSLLGNDSAFVFKNISVNGVNYSELASYNLIILNEIDDISTGLAQELQKFVAAGGSLFVVPSAHINVESYRSFLNAMGSDYYGTLIKATQKISAINLLNPVYNDVFESFPENIDLPQVMSYYSISHISKSNQEFLLKLQNGDMFLNQQSVGNGKVYLMAVPLQTDFSNFPKHAVFVPTIYKIAMLSSPQHKLYYTIGRDEVVNISTARDTVQESIYKLKQAKGSDEIIPEQRKTAGILSLMFHNQVLSNGNYLLMNENVEQSCISFNYNRQESNITSFTSSEINAFIDKNKLQNTQIIESTSKPLTQIITEMNQGIKLWKTFVLLALLFLAAEVLLLRLWK